MDRYGRALSKWLWPAWEARLRGRRTPELLEYLARTQYLPADELQRLQDGALRRLLNHAYQHVPWYRERFRERGLRPADIATRADLERLPVLGRAEARDGAEERRSTAPPFPVISKSTSGTQGMPLTFGYDLGSEEWRNAIRLRSYAWSGFPIGARSLHYWARPPKPPPLRARLKIGLDRSLKRELYVDCTPRADEDLGAAVAQIERHRPDVIITFSQAGAALARYVNRTGARTWGDIAVICGAERLMDIDRDAMHQAFGPGVFETYGSRETMLMAAECEEHDGMHEASENIIVELLVDEGGNKRAARPGEIGDVVVTDLHNYGMPFIRYANGDRAVAREPGPCRCGRAMPRLGPIEGRVTETLYGADGQPVSGLVFNLVFVDIAAVSKQFQVVQHGDRRITLRIVPTEQLSDAHIERVREHCSEYLPGVPLAIERVQDIPLTSAGKRKVVVVDPAAAEGAA